MVLRWLMTDGLYGRSNVGKSRDCMTFTSKKPKLPCERWMFGCRKLKLARQLLFHALLRAWN
jgi:hypothetical protein